MIIRDPGRIALIGLITCISQMLAQSPVLAQASAELPPPRYSADSLYNDANRYARDGKPGLAVLDYERAHLLAPNDPDIEANLAFVRTTKHLSTEPPSNFSRAVTFASPTLLAWTGLLGLVLAGGCLLAGQVSERHRGLRRAGVTLGGALIALTVGNGAVLWPALDDAVVLTDASPVRVSPVPMGDPLFVLPEAETVHITATHDEYVLVQTRTGKTGWMARANLAPVVPMPARP
jgi:hypothetical protein